MSRFFYQAKMVNGKLVQGELEATDDNEARVKLRAQQLIPVRLVAAANKPTKQVQSVGFFTPKVSTKDLKIFTRQLSTLINAGIPVVDALKLLSEGLRPGLLKEASSRVRSQIENGKRLADSMAQSPNVFDKLYVNMVKAGEEAGILDGILSRLAQYMEKSEKIKGQIKGAMVYPAAIIFVSIVVITGILVFIIPKFTELYSSAGVAPPALTMMVVSLSNVIIKNWPLVIAAFVGTPFGLIRYYNTDSGKEVFDRIFIQAPVVGDLTRKSAVARFSRTLSTLLSSGVGVIEALDIAAKTSGNKVIEEALLRSKESVMVGKPLANPLFKEKNIPDMVVQMISIGEQSGALDTMLSKIADFYEDEVETAVKAMTSLIEPILMVVLGGIIAVLVIAMYLPIFDMAGVASGGAK